jgi:hypothetical protein
MKWLAVFLFLSSLAQAGEVKENVTYSNIANQEINKAIQVQLEFIAKDYNQHLSDKTYLSSFLKRAKKTQLNDSLKEAVREFEKGEGKLDPVQFANGVITLSDPNNQVSVSAKEYLVRSVQVNGHLFQWNPKLGFAGNRAALRTLLRLPNHASSTSLFFPQALADGPPLDVVVPIEDGVIRLSFNVAVGQEGFELERLNDQIVEETKVCKSKDAPDYLDQSLLNAFYAIDPSAKSGPPEPEHFDVKSCDDFKNYRAGHVGDDGEWVTVEAKIPDSLCADFNLLVACLKENAKKFAESDKENSGKTGKGTEGVVGDDKSGGKKSNSAE